MVVVALIAILAAIAAPSYQNFVTSNRITAEINGLVTHLQYARSVAVKQGLNVTVTSNNGNNWSNGWTVANANGNLKQQQAFQGGDTLAAGLSVITYDRNGFTPNATTLTLNDQTNTVAFGKCVVVSAVGQLSVFKRGASPLCP